MKFVIPILFLAIGFLFYSQTNKVNENPDIDHKSEISKVEKSDEDHLAKYAHGAAILNDNCHQCHNPEKKKGKFELAMLGNVVNEKNVSRWNDVLDQVITEEMPPKEELSEKDRLALVGWIKTKIDLYVKNSVAKVKPETRRLTLKEYENSLCDVLGIDKCNRCSWFSSSCCYMG